MTFLKAAIFFSRSLKICSGSNILFHGLSFDFFLSSVYLFVERKANSAIEPQKVMVMKNEFVFLVQKMEFNYQISQRN